MYELTHKGYDLSHGLVIIRLKLDKCWRRISDSIYTQSVMWVTKCMIRIKASWDLTYKLQ